MNTKKPARWLWTLVAILIVPACAGNNDDAIIASIVSSQARIQLGFLGRYNTGIYNAGGAEIPAFDPVSKRLFVINAGPSTVDVLDLTNPAVPVLVTSISCLTYGGLPSTAGSPNSVAVSNGLVAIAVQNTVKTDNGEVVFFDAADATGFTTPLKQMAVGALPDMLCFTPAGNKVLVANEGEPTTDTYAVDPEGSVSIITLTAPGIGGAAGATVQQVTFTSFNSQKAALKAAGVRIFGKDVTGLEADGVASVARDLEPEYIATDGTTAWVTLQENNALAIVNIATATVTQIVPLGYKDHSLAINSLDPSDRELPGNLPLIQFVTGPIRGLYMPDGIAAYTVNGQTYLITANEGDAREYLTATPAAFTEEARISTLTLDATVFPNAAAIKANTAFGRLNVTTKTGDTDNDGDFDALYAFGARSVSIWSASGQQVWDSGDDIERITAAALPLNFNASHSGGTANALDDRSDNKGPEPEGVTVGQIDGRWYAFICLERVGGIIVYDVTAPTAPVFQTYINTRDFTQTPGPAAGAGLPVPGLDLGPEGMVFVPATSSPNGKPLLIVANEISGSTLILQVTKLFN